MNNKVLKAIESLAPEIREAYYDGALPDRFVIAMSRLTYWEQLHMVYEWDMDNPHKAIRLGLFDDLGNEVIPGDDRKDDIQAVINIFLEDQLSYRQTGKLKKWNIE